MALYGTVPPIQDPEIPIDKKHQTRKLSISKYDQVESHKIWDRFVFELILIFLFGATLIFSGNHCFKCLNTWRYWSVGTMIQVRRGMETHQIFPTPSRLDDYNATQ